MSGDLHEHKINLSEGQKRKLRIAYKKRKAAVIGLTKDQLTKRNGVNVLLNKQQHAAVTKAIKNKSGVRLILEYSQLLKNKEGGLLKEALELVENSVPYTRKYITPLIRQQVAPILKDHFVPWLKKLIDEELDTIIERDPKGAGLKARINKKLDHLLAGVRVKKN